MNCPFFSIVIPTFNRAQRLRSAVCSVLDQDFDDFEAIIVDDGSGDSTDVVAKELERIDSRIRYVSTPNWGGPARPRNIGINRSTGRFVAFLDDDDLWYSNKLSQTYESIKKHPGAGLFCHDEDIVHNGKQRMELRYGPYPSNMYEQLLFKCNLVSTSATVVRRDALITAGGFSEDKNLISTEDYDLWIRLAQNVDFVNIPITLGQYRTFSDSDNISRSLHRHADAYLHAVSKNLELWPMVGTSDTIAVSKRYSDAYCQASRIIAETLEYTKIFRYISCSIRSHPIWIKPYLNVAIVLLKMLWSRLR